MLKIIYTEKGNSYSDFNIIRSAEFIVEQYRLKIEQCRRDIIVKVSTSNIIQALRVLICRGILSSNEICIIFNDEEIFINEYCELTKHPKGFMDWEQIFLKEIIGSRLDWKD